MEVILLKEYYPSLDKLLNKCIGPGTERP